MKIKVGVILGILFALNLFFRIYQYRSDYLTPYNAVYWQKFYATSQWSPKKACTNLDPHVNPYTCIWDDNWYAKHKNDPNVILLKKHTIGDDAVYTYAGWQYIHGQDPTTLNAEIPPFGKYFIGLSEVIFQNQNIFTLLSGLFVLYAFYLLNKKLLQNKLAAFIPVALFSFEPLFFTQLNAPFIDNLYLGLLLMIFYFLIRKQFYVSAVFLGLITATKSPSSTFVLVIVVTLLYFLFTRQKQIYKKYFISLVVAVLIFLLTYIKYFLDGHSLRAFLGVQKYIFAFYASGAKGLLMTPWEMIVTGKWHTWWGTYIPVDGWYVGWPLSFVLSIVAGYFIVKNKTKESIILIALWVLVYLIFLSFIPTWPRYLLDVLPFMYTLSVWIIVQKVPKRFFKLFSK